MEINEKEMINFHLIILKNYLHGFSKFNQQHPFFFSFFSASRWFWVVRLTLPEGLWGYGTGIFVLVASYFDFLPTAVIYAKSLKNYLMFAPVLAETSIKVIPSFFNYSLAIPVSTALSSSRSFLFPMIKIRASSPLT